MNIAAAGAATPRLSSAGPMTTQLMMKHAVTGTARPRTAIAIAAKTAVSVSTAASVGDSASAAVTSRSASCCPSPVLVMVETMMPAAAQTAATGSTERTPSASA